MALVKVETSRIKIDDNSDHVIITIPSRKNWFLFLFLSFWLIGWVVGEVTVFGVISAGIIAFISGSIDNVSSGIPMGIFLSPNWLFWGLLILVLMRTVKHPPVPDINRSLTTRELLLGFVCLAIFILSFIPVPLRLA